MATNTDPIGALQRRIAELEKQVAASQQHGEFFTPAFSTGDADKQRIAELEKREAQMQAALDEHIQTHLKYPGMCIGISPQHGGLSVLEDRICLLLEYRFFFADLGRARWWWDYVKPTWPEGEERPGACGWRISVLYSGDESFEERFLPHLKKLVEKVYEDHGMTEETDNG